MRSPALMLIGTLALATAALPASAAPAVPKIDAAASASLIRTSYGDGCGPAYYRDAWGYCAPYGYGYGYGYGGWYGPSVSFGIYPHWGHWHHHHW